MDSVHVTGTCREVEIHVIQIELGRLHTEQRCITRVSNDPYAFTSTEPRDGQIHSDLDGGLNGIVAWFKRNLRDVRVDSSLISVLQGAAWRIEAANVDIASIFIIDNDSER